MFSFKLDKPLNIEVALKKLDRELKKENGSLSGNTQNGTIISDGVTGKYVVGERDIEITITESKYPRLLVEPYIKDKFKKINS